MVLIYLYTELMKMIRKLFSTPSLHTTARVQIYCCAKEKSSSILNQSGYDGTPVLWRAWFQVNFTKWHLTWLHLHASSSSSFNGSYCTMNFVEIATFHMTSHQHCHSHLLTARMEFTSTLHFTQQTHPIQPQQR